MDTKLNGGRFEFYPTNKIVGVLDRAGDVPRLLEQLTAGGVDASRVEVLFGEPGAQFLDMTGVRHGPWGRLVRFMQGLTDERALGKEYLQALDTGHYVVAVQTDGHDTSFPPVREAFKSATGHDLTFFGKAVTMPLET